MVSCFCPPGYIVTVYRVTGEPPPGTVAASQAREICWSPKAGTGAEGLDGSASTRISLLGADCGLREFRSDSSTSALTVNV